MTEVCWKNGFTISDWNSENYSQNNNTTSVDWCAAEVEQKMVLLETQLQFLQVESSACATYLQIARSTHSREHRQQALANAAAAYAAVKGHMDDVALSEEDIATLKGWVEKAEKELLSLVGAQAEQKNSCF